MNRLEKKLGWGLTIVAERLSSKYGQLALWTGTIGEVPGAALRPGGRSGTVEGERAVGGAGGRLSRIPLPAGIRFGEERCERE